MDFEKAQDLQNSVDHGHHPWRLDPVQVAMEEGQLLGFDPSKDRFKLSPKVSQGSGFGTGEVIVEAVHGNTTYIIQLIQPVKQGNAGI